MNVVANVPQLEATTLSGVKAEDREEAQHSSPVFAFSRGPLAEDRDMRNPPSRRADPRPHNPVKCGKRLRGLANAPQPNELVLGSVTAGQVSAVPHSLLSFMEGRGFGGWKDFLSLTFRPEPPTTLLIISKH